MATGLNNPEFPHSCIIYRISGMTPFSNKREKDIIYRGQCRRESSANIRTFKQGTSSVGQIVNVDYRVSIPGKWKICKGDIATIDFGIGSDKDVIITQPNQSGLTNPKYPQGKTEFYYSLPQT